MRRTSPVFWASLALVLPFIVWGAVAPDSLSGAADEARAFVIDKVGWFYLIVATAMLIGVIAIAASRFGRIRLGADDEQPEFSTLAWFSMLFSAGMGIGLVFWGVAEPVAHFTSPATAEPGGAEAARDALQYSFFHWGLHPWAIYSVLALALAYARFRRGWKATISGALRPVLGDRSDGPLGSVIDTLAVAATVFGVATSLGLGAAQVNGGLAAVFDGVEISSANQLAVIGVVTVLFLLSALTGIHRGIKWLSLVNITLAVAHLHVRPRDLVHRHARRRVHDHARQLPRRPPRPQPAGRSVRRGPQHVHQRLDGLLLGLVDLVVAVRRDLHRPHLPRPDRARVRRRRPRRADPGERALVRGVRHGRHPGRAREVVQLERIHRALRTGRR